MKTVQTKEFIIGACLTAGMLLLVVLLPGPVRGVDDAALTLQYRLRGERQIDSSIVLLYLDNDDIAALGGLPLRRNYYALIVNALEELGARTIGLEIGLTAPDRDHPEYDDLLSTVVRRSGKVVMSGYYRSLESSETSQLSFATIPDSLTWQLPEGFRPPVGRRGEFAFSNLLGNVAGLGHSNLTEELNIPIWIADGRRVVPAFSLELVRQFLGVPRDHVALSPLATRLAAGNGTVTIPHDAKGMVHVNYAGGLRSIHILSAVDILKSYDTLKSGANPGIAVNALRGKIVVVGIIAEGRSTFVETPYHHQFPAVAIHVMAIDNMLKGTFLTTIPQAAVYLVTLIAGLLASIFLSLKREARGVLATLCVLVILGVVSFLAFSQASLVIPIGSAFLTIIAVTLVMITVRHQRARREARTLGEENLRIGELLRGKEEKFLALREELARAQREQRPELASELRSEILRYRTELEELRLLAADAGPYETPLSGGQADSPRNEWGIVYTDNGPMSPVISLIRKVADTNAPVLILGESGTGKELVARALHENSARKSKAFVAVNCGALSESLLESELFGHEKGAFTGAMREKPGRFELAHEGTLFLDEIGETNESFQVKLLRVLQDGTYERVGGTTTRRADVRLIAATNMELKLAVDAGRFRKDLYYRLNVIAIQLPPLRERTGDIPSIAHHLLSTESPGIQSSAGVMKALERYPWPGNIRELQSVLKRGALLAQSDGRALLRTKDLPQEVLLAPGPDIDLEEQIIESLREKQFSRSAISETADELGGRHRGTVAEYFRGYCFRVFSETHCSLPATVETIAGTEEPEVRRRVEKKLSEYLANAIQFVDRSESIEQILASSLPKYKNLPQRYHPYLDQVLASFYSRTWSLEHHEVPETD